MAEAVPAPAIAAIDRAAAAAHPSGAAPAAAGIAAVEIVATVTDATVADARPSPASPAGVPPHSPADAVPPDRSAGPRIAWQAAVTSASDRAAAAAPHLAGVLPDMPAPDTPGVEGFHAPAPVVAPATAPSNHAATPAQQVAPTIELLARAGGSHSVVVQLHPDGLGKIELRIERAADGAATVSLTAERPETARALEHARPMLEAALDRAGLDPAQRSLTVAAQLAATPAHAASTQAAPAHAAPAQAASSSAAGTPAPDAGGAGSGMAGGGQRQGSRQDARASASDAPDPDDSIAATAGHRPRTWRLGVDITA